MVDLFEPLNIRPYWVRRPLRVGDRLAEVVHDRIAEVVDRLDGALLGELGHETGLGDAGDVGRVPSLHRGREQRREVVAARGELHGHVRVQLVEAGDDRLERLLLGACPRAHDRDRAADVLAALGATSAVVVSAATRRCERERANQQREYEPSFPHT